MQVAPNLGFLFNQFDLSFQRAYDQAPTYWDKIATEIPSGTAFNTYAWATRVARLREWVGERQLKSIAAYNYTLANIPFESTMEIDAWSIKNDQFGLFEPLVKDLGRAAKQWPDVLLFGSTGPLQNGQSIAIWDGTNFFSTSHPVSLYQGQALSTPTTYSNYTSSGGALTFDNYQTARATMMAYVGEDGNPLGVIPDLLVVPPQLEVTARLICEMGSVSPQQLGGVSQVGANDNPLRGTASVLVVPYLSGSATTWYLLDTGAKGGCGGAVRPFIFQNRQGAQLTTLTNATDYNVAMKNKYIYGVDTSGNVGQSLPFLAYKSVA